MRRLGLAQQRGGLLTVKCASLQVDTTRRLIHDIGKLLKECDIGKVAGKGFFILFIFTF